MGHLEVKFGRQGVQKDPVFKEPELEGSLYLEFLLALSYGKGAKVYENKSKKFIDPIMAQEMVILNHCHKQLYEAEMSQRKQALKDLVALFDDGASAMVLHYRQLAGDHLLEITAGTIERGEFPLNIAQHELEKEVGLLAKDLLELAQITIIPAYQSEKIHVFLARDLTTSKQNFDQNEILHAVK